MKGRRRDQLITLQRYTVTLDPVGEEVRTWEAFGTEWVAVFYGRGDERRQAAMEQGSQAATFQMLVNLTTLGLTIRDRIIHDGAAWDIQGIAPMDRQHIEATAVRAV